jgi:ABC-type dipeptide/oligopeptide/nickel transport system ATPase component
VITHDIAAAGYLADEIAVMFAGQIVEQGPAAAVIGEPRHPYTRLLIAALPKVGGRLAGQSKDGRDGQTFAVRAERVRAAALASTEALVEWRPGHFVRGTGAKVAG